MTSEADRLLEVDEVAEILKLKPSLVRRLVRQSEIPHVRLASRKIRFERAEIIKWLESRRVAPASVTQPPLRHL